MHRVHWVAPVTLLLAACASTPGVQESPARATPAQAAVAPVVRTPLTTQPLPPTAPETGTSKAVAPVVVPPNTLYVCVVDTQGVRQQTAIEFTAKVGALCRQHPEMGPCKYERNACRRGGGRVFAANGVEITPLIEADYDKRVLRVILRAD
jgi:hypothetical protein